MLGDVCNDVEVTRSHPVDLVNKDKERNAEPLQGAYPYSRLSLYAFDGRYDHNGRIEQPQYTLDFGDEIWVTGSIDQVDVQILDPERHYSRSDGYPALSFYGEAVCLGVAAIDTAEFGDCTCIEKEAFRKARFPCIHMS